MTQETWRVEGLPIKDHQTNGLVDEEGYFPEQGPRFEPTPPYLKAHHGQTDLNKISNTAKGTHQTSKWTPLGPQITEN